MTPVSASQSPRFGSVSVETVKKALDKPTVFQHGEKTATLSGPFAVQEGDQETARYVFSDTPGIDPDKPIAMYILGFNYPDIDGTSHGLVAVQDGQVHGLDLIG